MRFLISTVLGGLVAISLFLIMHSLITAESSANRDRDESVRLDFIQVDQDQIENIRKRTPPPEPEEPEEPPPPPELAVADTDRPSQVMPNIEMPSIDLGVSAGNGPYLGNWQAGDPGAEGDVIPIVRIEPQFPREALINGTEGWVDIEFTIEPDGSVSNPKVVAAEPRRIFDRNAIRAIYKWKFKPRIIDGQPVARQARQRLDFKLDQ